MFTLKKGKKLNKSFKIYSCKRCDYKGIVCDNDEIVNHARGTKYAAEFYSRKTKQVEGYDLPHTVCPNCGQTMGYALYTDMLDKEYMDELLGVQVTLENGTKTVLVEDDLFY